LFFVYTVIWIMAGGYTGQGSIWGVGFSGARFGGNLRYDSWEELTSAKNDIQMSNSGLGVDVVFVQFFNNRNQVAYLKVTGSDVHSPASSHGPGQARLGQSHGPTMALAWLEIPKSQSHRLRLWLLNKFLGIWMVCLLCTLD
jgi:hypothetical protein